MQVDYPYIPLIRINAPEVFADQDFKHWFLYRPKATETAAYAPAIATWHQPQAAEFGEYSDFFTTVDGVANGDHADGDGSESDMPQHLWRQLVTAAWEALDRPDHFECLLWVSNLPDTTPPPKMNDADSLQITRELYKIVFDATASFEEDDVGSDLAYLMGAVLEGTFCEWHAGRPLVRLLREQLPPLHPVWKHIHVQLSTAIS